MQSRGPSCLGPCAGEFGGHAMVLHERPPQRLVTAVHHRYRWRAYSCWQRTPQEAGRRACAEDQRADGRRISCARHQCRAALPIAQWPVDLSYGWQMNRRLATALSAANRIIPATSHPQKSSQPQGRTRKRRYSAASRAGGIRINPRRPGLFSALAAGRTSTPRTGTPGTARCRSSRAAGPLGRAGRRAAFMHLLRSAGPRTRQSAPRRSLHRGDRGSRSRDLGSDMHDVDIDAAGLCLTEVGQQESRSH